MPVDDLKPARKWSSVGSELMGFVLCGLNLCEARCWLLGWFILFLLANCIVRRYV